MAVLGLADKDIWVAVLGLAGEEIWVSGYLGGCFSFGG